MYFLYVTRADFKLSIWLLSTDSVLSDRLVTLFTFFSHVYDIDEFFVLSGGNVMLQQPAATTDGQLCLAMTFNRCKTLDGCLS